jgi:hypothetical protein
MRDVQSRLLAVAGPAFDTGDEDRKATGVPEYTGARMGDSLPDPAPTAPDAVAIVCFLAAIAALATV